MKIVSAFNHKGGVGKTTMTFNLACRLAEMGRTCLIIDADPQCNSTCTAVDDDKLDEIYSAKSGTTLFHAVEPLLRGTGDIAPPDLVSIDEWNVFVVPGDLFVSRFEDVLAREWNNIFKPEERAARFTSAMYRLARELGGRINADYIFFDLGPSIGPLNQFAILASHGFVVPVTPDIFSVRAMASVGATVKQWANDYAIAKPRLDAANYDFDAPEGKPKFLGYAPQQFGIYRKNPAQAFKQWIDKLDGAVRDHLVKGLAKTDAGSLVAASATKQPKIAELQNYHSLVPAAQSARRPIFSLRGNIEVNPGHMGKVNSCKDDYETLAAELEKRMSAA